MLPAIVHGDGQADEFRHHGGTTRPGFYRALVIGRARRLDLLHQVGVNERAFFNGTCHVCYPLL